jgi:hypothetical protein
MSLRALFLATLLSLSSLLAQNQATTTQTSTLSGRLDGAGTDQATVTITNTATGASQSTTTDGTSSFTFANLPAGSYKIGVRLKSGATLLEQTAQLAGTGTTQLVLTLTGPEGETTLEIEGRSPTLQTDAAEVSRQYSSQTIRSLPVADRQNHELISLMPGITPPTEQADRVNDPQRTRAFNVNGQPTWENLYNQDGSYANEPFYARPIRVLPNEGVMTLEVRTSNYNSEYGVAGGSWSSNVTRPGTNALHGSLFAFHTNSFLRAGKVLNATQDTPGFNVNQFGGTIGGPVVTDNMFWFLSYEGFLQRGRQEAIATVPTAAGAAGNFSEAQTAVFNPFSGTPSGMARLAFPNSTVPVVLRNPTSAQILGLLPAPNAGGVTNNLVGSVPLRDDTHRIDGKLDHRFSDKSTGFLRYGFTQGSVNQGSLLGALGAPQQAELRSMSAVGSLSHVVTPNLLGEFRVGYHRYRNLITPWGDFSSLGALGFPTGLPQINIAGFSPLGLPPNVPSKQIDNIYDGATNWVAHVGSNTVRFGLTARALEVNGITNPFFGQFGSFTFGPGATLGSTGIASSLNPAMIQANSLAGFILGTPTQSGITNFTTTPAYRQMQYSAYVSDTVNLFQRVWLELGVRYDVFSPVEPNQPGGATVYDPFTNTTSVTGLNGAPNRIARYDMNNIAPRVGLAIRPVDRVVIRAGYGMLYFPMPFSALPFNPAANSVQSGLAGGLTTTTFTTPIVPAGTAVAANTPFYTSPRSFATPFLHTYSAMIQGDLGAGFLLDVGYVGNMGRQLPLNSVMAGAPGTGTAGLLIPGRTAPVFQVAPGLTSNYNSGQVNLTKRFSKGLSFTGAYTYGKALDYGFTQLNPFNRASNYGPADWDRTHILSLSHVWRLPFGVNRRFFQSGALARVLGDWEFTGLVRWATGTPYSITTDPTACACLGVASLPASFAPTATFTNLGGASSFNPAQFVAPAPGTFGTATRNSFRGPEFFNYNAALFRNFAINENTKIELRGEVYNLTNTSNPMNPVSSFSSPGFGSSLGNMNGQAGRQFQVAGRLLF